MKVKHRVSFTVRPPDREDLAALGIHVGDGLVAFVIDDADTAWPAVSAWVARRRAVHTVSTEFSSDELSTAEWLELLPDWHHGYPQPADDFGYLALTYDLSHYCPSCGVGAIQKAPFRMRREPAWGRRSILQLNWVFDEFFVTPATWRSVFAPLGVASQPVLHRSGRELATVVQLVSGDDDVDVETEGLEARTCPDCRRVKYASVVRGPFPRLHREPTTYLARTRQYFGSGASAYRAVLASAQLVGALRTHEIRGVSFKPVDR